MMSSHCGANVQRARRREKVPLAGLCGSAADIRASALIRQLPKLTARPTRPPLPTQAIVWVVLKSPPVIASTELPLLNCLY
jgi:hypothetical protein